MGSSLLLPAPSDSPGDNLLSTKATGILNDHLNSSVPHLHLCGVTASLTEKVFIKDKSYKDKKSQAPALLQLQLCDLCLLGVTSCPSSMYHTETSNGRRTALRTVHL